MTLIRILPLLLMLFGFTGVAVAVEAPPKSDAPAAVAHKAAAGNIDINKADAVALQEGMIGVGEMKAKAIVAYREANGAFTSIDDLLQVKGIGAKTLEANRDRLSID